MQLLGIYINQAAPRIRRSLKEKHWYPFGSISDCHNIFSDNSIYENIYTEIIENQKINNFLFSYKNRFDEKKLKININCIVGKNGTGKSTLLDLLYSIINNFSLRLSSVFDIKEKAFNPIWCSGFDAKLFFECEGKIGCIHSKNKKTDEENIKYPVCLHINDNNDLFESFKDNNSIIKEIANSFFYTIGINYGLYSNTNSLLAWKSNLYHKNDGYFTPIVLLPYRDDDTIDITKELKLAEERVEILSLLLASQNVNFIPGYSPYRITYRLKNSNTFEKEKRKEIYEYFKKWIGERNSDKEDEIKEKCNELIEILKTIWEKKIVSNTSILPDVKKNALMYLAYKTIKICMNYTEYKSKKIFQYLEKLSQQENIIDLIKDNKLDKKLLDSVLKIEKTIDTFLTVKDHITQKLRHTYHFLCENVYIAASQLDGYISADEFTKLHKGKTYEDIYMDLLPPIYNKNFLFNKEGSKQKIELKDMSSGESQMLFALSYVIYHMKNLQSIQQDNNRIKYKNINLVLDEAELYFHPEYQRTFIDKLIQILYSSNLTSFTSINITIVTHSPFMLCDIPSSNVLCLRKKENEKDEILKTFSANIFDLVKNPFFLEAPVGGVPERLFNEIIEDYKKVQQNTFGCDLIKYKKQSEIYEKMIDLIGDNYFKYEIKKRYFYLKALADAEN